MAGKKTPVFKQAREKLAEIISKYPSMREFARVIQEDSSDVLRWKDGKVKIHPRAVVTIAKMFGVEPEILRPDLFTGVNFVFKKEKK